MSAGVGEADRARGAQNPLDRAWVDGPRAPHRPSLLARADPAERACCTPSRRAEQAGFTAGMSSDHFAPWSVRQGESGFAWSFLGAALAPDVAAVRGRQRAGTALPPGDHRPGRGDAVRDVPGAAVDRARVGRGVQRAHHRRGLAARRPTATQRLRECVDIMRALFARRGGLALRARHRRPRAAVDAAGDAAAAAVRGGEREDRGAGAPSGRTGWRRSTRRSSTLQRMLDAFGPTTGARCCRCTSAGRRPTRRRARSPTTSGARTSSTRRCAGTWTRPRPSTPPRSSCTPEDLDGKVLISSRPRAARRVAAGVRRARLRRHRHPPRRPGPRRRSSTPSASTSCRSSHERSRPPATCGGRTPSSTASTSRCSTTTTATAAATSPG